MRRALLACLLAVAASACDRAGDERAVALPGGVRPTPVHEGRFATIGRAATDAQVRAWDIDVNPSGTGLPPGRGTWASGAAVYAQKCAACHGPHAEGAGTYPRLVGRDPREGFPFGQDLKHVKTVGNYWPYATTLFDYVRRAMPLTQPGSLSADEVYGVTAFLLAENEVVGRDAVMDAHSLPLVRMPARDRFVKDDRAGGASFR